MVDLAPQGHPPARLAIEYAIWWDWDNRFLRIGHRGNTLLGIRTTASLGADLVEIDVHHAKRADGHVVLSHEEHYANPSGRIHFVEHSTLAELQTIDLGQGERIPTLAQAIKFPSCCERSADLTHGAQLRSLLFQAAQCLIHGRRGAVTAPVHEANQFDSRTGK